MAQLTPFAPHFGSGSIVAPGAATASTELGRGNKSICITNLNTVVSYVRTGPSDVEATTADYPIPASGQVVISKSDDDTHIAYITAGAAGSLHIMSGEGF